MDSLTAPLFTWISAHPQLAGLVVAFVAFSESLALIGLFLPGAALMFGVGALVGAGALDLWLTLAWSAVGAIAGDSVSFWLGKRFHQRIKIMWPFSKHPELIARSTDFFYRHGAKSIVFARFIGPLRPIVPAVAGMLDMPGRRFFPVNVISGLFWAPVYVVPGMVFATSLGLAAEVATRLAVMIGLLIAVVLLFVWLARRSFNLIHPHALVFIHRLMEWSTLHPLAGHLPATLLDPEHPEARGLTLMAVILLLAAVVFGTLLHAISGAMLPNVDTYLLHTLQSLRTPWIDQLMVVITEMGDSAVLAPLFVALLIWLGWKRRWMAAAHWLGATLFALALTQTIQWAFQTLRPGHGGEVMDAFSFPSGPSTLSVVIYGFLAVLITRESRLSLRWLIYMLFALLIGAIAFSRIYLGIQLFSDVSGGLALGLIWVALLGIAYRRHPAATLPLGGLLTLTALTVTISFGWHYSHHFNSDMKRYAVKVDYHMMARSDWWEKGWQTLPASRNDLRGWHSQPLSIQYAGDLAVLEKVLSSHGWSRPLPVTTTSWLQWFNATTPPQQQPLLPQLHDGRNETLRLISLDPTAPRLLVLRLWESGIHLQPDDVPLWIGNVSYLAVPPGARLYLPRVQANFDQAFDAFVPQISDLPHRLSPPSSGRGTTLLLEDGKEK
jgi:membrane protein DedA with SNARE-associated domain/membrane-associated phospholipid phosphatase